MAEHESPTHSLRIITDSMYDPADTHRSLMVDDIVVVDASKKAEDGDLVLVSFGGKESVMKVAIEDGARVFRYTAPDRSDCRLTDKDAAITGVVTARHRHYVSGLTGPLKWRGDDIGLCNDIPIRVSL